MIKYLYLATLVMFANIAHAACPNQTSSIVLVAGGAPVHVTVRNAVTCAADPPGGVSWTLSGPAAGSVTITPDATGFNFTAAMGSSGAATASTMSVSLAISITSGGIAVPPGAQAAGQTTLAFNSDFTQTMPALWLGGCATPGNGQPVSPAFFDDGGPHLWWMNIWWSANYLGCFPGQVTDPKYGGLVLNIPWTVDNCCNSIGDVIETASWDYNATTHAGQVKSFPIGSYYEVVSRIEPIGSRGTYMVLNTWAPDAIANSGCGCTMEWDVMETDNNRLDLYDSNARNWGNGGSTASNFILFPWTTLAPGTAFDPTNYNTYGLRVTTDGTSMIGCTYINNVFQACRGMPNGISPTEANERNFLVLQNACDWWNDPSGTTPNCNQGQAQNLYVKSVRVWGCAAWATTQCNGTLLSGPP